MGIGIGLDLERAAQLQPWRHVLVDAGKQLPLGAGKR